MEIIVVIKQMPTKIAPIINKSPPERIRRRSKNPISEINTDKRNQCFAKNPGSGLFKLNFGITISRKAPLGHKFQHQYLALKNERVRKNAIIPTII
jgi:hypothetical protein